MPCEISQSVSERQIPYYLTYMWTLMNKIMNTIETEAQIHGTDSSRRGGVGLDERM